MDGEVRRELNKLRQQMLKIAQTQDTTIQALGQFMEEMNGKLTEIDDRLRVATDESRFLFREAQRQINAVNEFLEEDDANAD